MASGSETVGVQKYVLQKHYKQGRFISKFNDVKVGLQKGFVCPVKATTKEITPHCLRGLRSLNAQLLQVCFYSCGAKTYLVSAWNLYEMKCPFRKLTPKNNAFDMVGSRICPPKTQTISSRYSSFLEDSPQQKQTLLQYAAILKPMYLLEGSLLSVKTHFPRSLVAVQRQGYGLLADQLRVPQKAQ